ncbi:hypothetical protein AGLY_007826 [Aphis glycines]|uniref:Uncharacterized protein n=1 Tax=Aphis glycines TaxID=307491 RepID=A0A6G0TN42_APHGL|nr:hypothetical protein AGLY_007826 [Aphis glycines]
MSTNLCYNINSNYQKLHQGLIGKLLQPFTQKNEPQHFWLMSVLTDADSNVTQSTELTDQHGINQTRTQRYTARNADGQLFSVQSCFHNDSRCSNICDSVLEYKKKSSMMPCVLELKNKLYKVIQGHYRLREILARYYFYLDDYDGHLSEKLLGYGTFSLTPAPSATDASIIVKLNRPNFDDNKVIIPICLIKVV